MPSAGLHGPLRGGQPVALSHKNATEALNCATGGFDDNISRSKSIEMLCFLFFLVQSFQLFPRAYTDMLILRVVQSKVEQDTALPGNNFVNFDVSK